MLNNIVSQWYDPNKCCHVIEVSDTQGITGRRYIDGVSWAGYTLRQRQFVIDTLVAECNSDISYQRKLDAEAAMGLGYAGP